MSKSRWFKRALVVLAIAALVVPAYGVMGPAHAETTNYSEDTTLTSDLVIDADDKVTLSPGVTLTMDDSSILVYGELELRGGGTLPAEIGNHIRFININESEFTGVSTLGPTGPEDDLLDTDPGLYVMDAGVLDAEGTFKQSWSTLFAGVNAGASIVEVYKGTHGCCGAPGWLVGDEVVISPTVPGDTSFEVRTVSSLGLINEGKRAVGLSAPLSNNHPTVVAPEGFGPEPSIGEPPPFTPEIANLTRDVTIEGTATGKSHIFMRSTSPQTLKYVQFRHLGPRKVINGNEQKVNGRWPVHFHKAKNGAIGSVVEGNVARDVGSHALVPHDSNGVLLKDNVVFTFKETALWWDPIGVDPDPDSDHTVFDHNFVANSVGGPQDITGMFFGDAFDDSDPEQPGENVLKNTVIVGVHGNAQSSDPSGYGWSGQGFNGWITENNVAHNNSGFGTWLYGNPSFGDDYNSFITYNNGLTGIHHGAYDNRLRYFDSLSFNNTKYGLEIKAVGKTFVPGEHVQTHVGEYHGALAAVNVTQHVKDFTGPAVVLQSDLRSNTSTIVRVMEGAVPPKKGAYDFVECVVDDRELATTDFNFVSVHSGSRYRIQRLDGTASQYDPVTQTWSSIPAFYPYE